MATKHIIKIGYQAFACDDKKTAHDLLALFAKLQPVDHVIEGDPDEWYYTPEIGVHSREITLKPNQLFRPSKAEKPSKSVKAPKALSLPSPKRGSILCICEKSYVAPRESCPHCGRLFAESHNRTHGDAVPVKPQLRLL
jgi:hypothetical protein